MQHWYKGTYREGKPCPVGRSRHAAVCIGYSTDNLQLFVIGGRGNDWKQLTSGWMLDGTGTWEEVRLSTFKYVPYIARPFTAGFIQWDTGPFQGCSKPQYLIQEFIFVYFHISVKCQPPALVWLMHLIEVLVNHDSDNQGL